MCVCVFVCLCCEALCVWACEQNEELTDAQTENKCEANAHFWVAQKHITISYFLILSFVVYLAFLLFAFLFEILP